MPRPNFFHDNDYIPPAGVQIDLRQTIREGSHTAASGTPWVELGRVLVHIERAEKCGVTEQQAGRLREAALLVKAVREEIGE
jgi:hypothetical protein